MSVTRISLGRRMRASPISPRGDNRQDSIKDQFCFKHIRGRRSGCVHCWLLERDKRNSDRTISHAIKIRPSRRPDMFTLHDVRYLREAMAGWITNHGPRSCFEGRDPFMQSLPCTNARRLARWWSHKAISLSERVGTAPQSGARS
jgi:hypothetical protein